MSDPSLRLTFQTLQIRVADFLGIADRSGSALAVPTDAKDLELVKRLVNDGYRRFVSESEKWNFLNVPLAITFVPQQTLTLTGGNGTTTLIAGSIAGTYANDVFNGFEVTVIDTTTGTKYVYLVADYTGSSGTFTFTAINSTLGSGDTLEIAGLRNVAGQADRYYLPDDFYGLWRPFFTYDENGPRTRIDEVPESMIREFKANNLTTGTPAEVAFRPINVDATADGKRWEAIFWPEPSGTETVSARYRRFPALLSANGDVSVAGFHHDGTVLAASLAAAELYRNDKIGIHEATYQAKLSTSKKLDSRATPMNSRPYGDNSNDGWYTRPSSDFRPETYNGVDI